jgi:hypothetical protein
MAKGNQGISSNKLVRRPQPKVEPRAKGVSPGGVSQLGEHVGTRKAQEPMYQGKGFNSAKAGQPNNMVSGPGGGRTVMATGSQSQHGPAAGTAPPPSKDTLSEYGPRK